MTTATTPQTARVFPVLVGRVFGSTESVSVSRKVMIAVYIVGRYLLKCRQPAPEPIGKIRPGRLFGVILNRNTG